MKKSLATNASGEVLLTFVYGPFMLHCVHFMILPTLQTFLPAELLVFLMAMLPITELQGAIVAGVTVLGLNPWLAFILATAGNILVSILIYYTLGPVTNFLRKHIVWIDKLCARIFQHTRDKHSKRMSEVGHFLLFLYLAIPTPGSGGWSGALIAHVFGVPARAFIPLAVFGLISAGILVTFGAEIVLFIFGGNPV